MSETIEPGALVPMATTDLVAIFTAPGGVDAVIARLERDARAAAAELDISTPRGRKEIASLAYKVARSKTALDTTGRSGTGLTRSPPKSASHWTITRRQRMRGSRATKTRSPRLRRWPT